MLRARLATAAIAIPLLLLLIFAAPPWVYAAVVGVLALLGVLEFVSMAFPGNFRERAVGTVLGAGVIAGALWGPSACGVQVLQSTRWCGGPEVAWLGGLAVVLMLGLSWTVVGRADFERGFNDLGLTLVGVLYVGFLLPHFVWLRQTEQGPAWVTFILATSMLGDTGGYFVGHAIGRHKLAPRISPGKTIEGSVGILLGTVAASLAAKVILSYFVTWFVTWREALWLGVILAGLSQLGDLAESVMKRTFGVKESGWMFPGHGGVLDRIDSLLFPVGFVYYYIVFVR